jgi:hypothetical protein
MDPLGTNRLFLNVEAPLPSGKFNRRTWAVSIDRWETDEVDFDGQPAEEHGEPVIRCVHPTRPTVADVVDLLDRGAGEEQLAAWARTTVGESLSDTAFVVTERFEN